MSAGVFADSGLLVRLVKMLTESRSSHSTQGKRSSSAAIWRDNPDSYPKPGVQGHTSERKFPHKIYAAPRQLWVYPSPGVDPSRARAADGAGRIPGVVAICRLLLFTVRKTWWPRN